MAHAKPQSTPSGENKFELMLPLLYFFEESVRHMLTDGICRAGNQGFCTLQKLCAKFFSQEFQLTEIPAGSEFPCFDGITMFSFENFPLKLKLICAISCCKLLKLTLLS